MEITPEMQAFAQDLFTQQMQREKELKLERFRRLNPFAQKGQVLFCGSSLMEQFPINELLMDLGLPLTVYNRGVGGFTTAEMAQALEPCVFGLEPAHIFINIGTNDLNGPDYTLSGLMERYEDILARIQARLPRARIYMLAYYPVNEQVGEQSGFMGDVFRYRTNERIAQANRAAAQLAAKMGAEFLDLNAGITDPHGRMTAQYTIEGMHMYPDGYERVLQALLPTLRRLAGAGLGKTNRE